LFLGAIDGAIAALFPSAGEDGAGARSGVAVKVGEELSAGGGAGLGAESVTGAGRSADRVSVLGAWSSPQPTKASGRARRASNKGEIIRAEQEIRGDFTKYSFEVWFGAGKLRP
jgi:hypothetical protein